MIKLTAAKCPQCGADIEVNPELEKSICQYCGTTILVQEAIQKIELSGSVKVAGIKNRDDYMELAKKHYKIGEYLDALENLSTILAEDSFDIEAFCELVKNDYKLLKQANYDFRVSEYNNNYNKDLASIYDDMLMALERLTLIDEKNEKAKYFSDFQTELDEYEKMVNEYKEREDANKKIVDKLNEDLNSIKEYNYYDYYDELIGNSFKTVDTVHSCRFAKESDNYDSYVIDKYNKITLDGILVVDYNKKSFDYKSNPAIHTTAWMKYCVPSNDFNEIDERYKNYCDKIEEVKEKTKNKREEIDAKDEKTRKKNYRKYSRTMYLQIIYTIALLGANAWAIISGSRFWAPVLVFFVDTWAFKFFYDDFVFAKKMRKKYVKKETPKNEEEQKKEA